MSNEQLARELQALSEGGAANLNDFGLFVTRNMTAILAALRAAEPAADVVEALRNVIAACDQGRMIERGVGGMTLEAQLHRSVINGVPAWPIEEARTTLYAALQAQPAEPSDLGDFVRIPVEAYEFLMGQGPLEGCQFGEQHPDRPGAFWWRAVIQEREAAIRALRGGA